MVVTSKSYNYLLLSWMMKKANKDTRWIYIKVFSYNIFFGVHVQVYEVVVVLTYSSSFHKIVIIHIRNVNRRSYTNSHGVFFNKWLEYKRISHSICLTADFLAILCFRKYQIQSQSIKVQEGMPPDSPRRLALRILGTI